MSFFSLPYHKEENMRFLKKSTLLDHPNQNFLLESMLMTRVNRKMPSYNKPHHKLAVGEKTSNVSLKTHPPNCPVANKRIIQRMQADLWESWIRLIALSNNAVVWIGHLEITSLDPKEWAIMFSKKTNSNFLRIMEIK